MFERFTDRSRKVLVLAQDESVAFGHGYIGTEHLLLGLAAEGEGVAAEALHAVGVDAEAVRAELTTRVSPDLVGEASAALATIGIDLEQVRREVDATFGPGAMRLPMASPPFTPRAKAVLERALEAATSLGHNYVGTEHLLLGLVGDGQALAGQILVGLGTNEEAVRRSVLSVLDGAARIKDNRVLAELNSLGRAVSVMPPSVREPALTVLRTIVYPARAQVFWAVARLSPQQSAPESPEVAAQTGVLQNALDEARRQFDDLGASGFLDRAQRLFAAPMYLALLRCRDAANVLWNAVMTDVDTSPDVLTRIGRTRRQLQSATDAFWQQVWDQRGVADDTQAVTNLAATAGEVATVVSRLLVDMAAALAVAQSTRVGAQ